ncbi:hypothetical protein QVD17_06095 [Tagetes erecta]|uniref:Uncharacterized protein n=1 Tax=Tagetes erecta TaxID=13708 RepID=A0AAD8LD55_TARER|nr:hypothetical protein QVD17_06095 [Tagetes erecta]
MHGFQGLVVAVVGGVKTPGKDGVVVGKGKNGIPDEPNGGNVDKGGVWSVGIGKLPPRLGRPGMFKRRRLVVVALMLLVMTTTKHRIMISLVEAMWPASLCVLFTK